MKSTIIIPTYNESENIERLIRQVLALPGDFRIIVVDDNSPDGTGKILDKLASQLAQIRVLHRPRKLGLGTANIEGFKLALKEKADLIFQMDGDLSHQPHYLIQMLEAIKNCDLVVGSRYIPGGGVKNWGLLRRLLSRMANLYVRKITGMPLYDSTSGLKCFRREVIEYFNLDCISSEGYAFQIEMDYLAWKNNFRIQEIPIVFSERLRGKSKLNRKIIFEAFWLAWKLCMKGIFGRKIKA
ncbi:MAG: polyprenol monophosphomannose synthase [Candidatus Omnitrophica bacterium]|nr:polyprenol monophosphomannose synthase [Candidatus Omnitrophota bacterium]